MRTGWPVADAFRRAVGFGPDYVAAQIPAIGLQGQGHAPRDADQVFGFDRQASEVGTRPTRWSAGVSGTIGAERLVCILPPPVARMGVAEGSATACRQYGGHDAPRASPPPVGRHSILRNVFRWPNLDNQDIAPSPVARRHHNLAGPNRAVTSHRFAPTARQLP